MKCNWILKHAQTQNSPAHPTEPGAVPVPQQLRLQLGDLGLELRHQPGLFLDQPDLLQPHVESLSSFLRPPPVSITDHHKFPINSLFFFLSYISEYLEHLIWLLTSGKLHNCSRFLLLLNKVPKAQK
uniref:Uncharacterized protein n=1 Tax=Xiphophorus couchianus TaxID=32473 RepID=A0A3B5LNH5_9TELE